MGDHHSEMLKPFICEIKVARNLPLGNACKGGRQGAKVHCVTDHKVHLLLGRHSSHHLTLSQISR